MRSDRPLGALCCCGRSRTGRVARAAEKLVNLLGGATFDLFFSELLVHLPGPHTPQWVAEANALCYAQRAFADPCSAVPAGSALGAARPGRVLGLRSAALCWVPCPRSQEQDQPFPSAAARPGAPVVPDWVSGQWLCWPHSTLGACSELAAAPSLAGPTEQGRGWGGRA